MGCRADEKIASEAEMSIRRARFPKSLPGRAASWLLVTLLVASETASPQTPAFSQYPTPTISYGDGMTVGPDGALWFTETLPNPGGSIPTGKIGRITTAGAITEYPVPDLKYGPLKELRAGRTEHCGSPR